jgi:hypothetical protein
MLLAVRNNVLTPFLERLPGPLITPLMVNCAPVPTLIVLFAAPVTVTGLFRVFVPEHLRVPPFVRVKFLLGMMPIVSSVNVELVLTVAVADESPNEASGAVAVAVIVIEPA